MLTSGTIIFSNLLRYALGCVPAIFQSYVALDFKAEQHEILVIQVLNAFENSKKVLLGILS